MKKRIIGIVLSIVLVMGSPFMSYASEIVPEETDSIMMVESMGFADEDLEEGCTKVKNAKVYTEPSVDSEVVGEFEYNWQVFYTYENPLWSKVEIHMITYDDEGNCNDDVTRGYMQNECISLNNPIGLPYDENMVGEDVG